VQTRRFINQTITLLMATMLLMVSGAKSWSGDEGQGITHNEKALFENLAQEDPSKAPEGNQATVSSLSLHAVITPAISFDFFQYFYFLPSAVWSFVKKEKAVEVIYTETSKLLSCFNRIFGRYIVTNAP
jgi:hypothetical protein